MDRWWFHMIAGPDGSEAQVRVVLRRGDDESAFPALQVGLDGEEVPVDDSPVDYEAPEWKVAQLLEAGGGGGQATIDALKERLQESFQG